MFIIADKIEIRIDGKTYDNYVFSDIRLVQEIQKPNEFRFLMHKSTMTEDENDIRFSLSEELLGKKVEYFLSTTRDDESMTSHQDTLEFTGIIFNVNALRKNLKAEMVIEVTAYSPDYLLIDNLHCYSYEKETLKNIISKTLEPYNIPVQNDPAWTNEIPYTVQYNETSYAFISRLASRFGEWLYFDGKELIFGKIKKLDSLELQTGYDVLNYQYRLDMEHLNFSHAQHNYLEYENSKNDATSVTGQSMHNMTDIAYQHSKSIYSKETFQHLKCSAAEDNFDETELSVKVQGLGKKAKMMVCVGNTNRADLRIGSIIKIKEYFETGNGETSSCYHDELLICKVTHNADSNGSYENEFMAVPATCEYPPYTYSNNNYPKAESQRAVVKDNQDPENLGRIRVQFLWQQEQDDSLITPWIRIAQPHGGDNKGFYFIPEIDEEVMVGFENGNAEKPYAIGTLYHGQQHPGSNWPNGNNDIKAIRTRNGHTVEINDAGAGGFIRIYDNEKENYILTFSTDEKLIKLQSTGNIELYAENDIIIEAKNNINMKAGVDMNRDAGQNIKETAGTDITTSAGSNISTDAGKDISTSAGSNVSTKAGENMSTSAGENISIDAGQDMDTNVGSNETLHVGSNQTIEIGANKDESISEKYQLTAQSIRTEASDKLQLYSQTHEQKADSSMKLDGGSNLDLYASSIKIN